MLENCSLFRMKGTTSIHHGRPTPGTTTRPTHRVRSTIRQLNGDKTNWLWLCIVLSLLWLRPVVKMARPMRHTRNRFQRLLDKQNERKNERTFDSDSYGVVKVGWLPHIFLRFKNIPQGVLAPQWIKVRIFRLKSFNKYVPYGIK